MGKVKKPIWDPDTGRHRTLPTLNWQIAGMAFWVFILIGNLLGFLSNVGEDAVMMTINLFMIPACLFFLNGSHEAYKEQIQKRAEWRKLKYEAFLGRPWDLPSAEDWPAIEAATEDMLKNNVEPTLERAKRRVHHQKEREKLGERSPCKHENRDKIMCGFSESYTICSDCGVRPVNTTNTFDVDDAGNIVQTPNPFRRRD